MVCNFFLRIWRRWISEIENDSNKYTVKDNFITPNAYECIEINGHALIQLMIKFRNEKKTEQFVPTLFSSQPCESTFRQFRSMTSIYWTKINSSLLEMFHIVGRIELQNYITHHKIPQVKFPRSQEQITKMESHELPSDEEIFHQMNVARDNAIEVAKSFEIHFDDEDLNCQLPVCEARPEELDESDNSLLETSVAADKLCESIGQLNLENGTDSVIEEVPTFSAGYDYGLRDYTDQNIILSDLCPFTKVTNKNGESKVVRKSSVLWALTNTKCSLSNDRLTRVQGKAIEKANSRTLSNTKCTTITQLSNADTRKADLVWEADEILIGDWCFFYKKKISNSLDDLFIGQVVGFKYIVGKTAKEKQYSWDNAHVKTTVPLSHRRGIEVLATWYEYRENGHLIPITSGVRHFYMNIKHYVATTKAIKRSTIGKVNLISTELIFFNQELLNLLGKYAIRNTHYAIV